jgi:sugar phosphate isomerase/epimerase
MPIQFFCPRWGSESLSWDAFCKKAKNDGYDGIEYAIAAPVTNQELDEVWNTVTTHGLQIIAQHFDTYEADFSKHYDLFCAWLERMKPYPVVKINSQTGKDFFSFEQNHAIIKAALDFTKNTGVNVVHETHRNKFSFAAHITKEYLERIPELQITLDASHWVCVAESLLDDQPEAMQLAIERAEHIHARVGYPEGPQVADPRLPEWKDVLQRHIHWWSEVVKRKRTEKQLLTITPEFGPYPYMVHIPATGEPVSDQWQVNVFMMKLLRKQFHVTEEEGSSTLRVASREL